MHQPFAQQALAPVAGPLAELPGQGATGHLHPRALAHQPRKHFMVVFNPDQALGMGDHRRVAGGYQLEPLNGLDWAGETRPYEGIRYIGNAWTFDRFRATVAVTADWGWAALPDQVVRTHYVLAKDVWEFRSQQGNAGMDEFLENKAKMLLKGYRREEAKAGIGGPR